MNPEVANIVGRLAGMKAAADDLARLPPMGPQFLARVGRAYSLLGDHREASDFLRRAADAAPYDAGNQYNLGAALIFTGQLDEARKRLKEALRIQPRHYLALYSLVSIEKQTPEANRIGHMTALFDGPDPTGDRTLHLGHGLAKACEDLEQYEEAFDWLVKGKAVLGGQANYSSAQDDALFAAATAAGSGPADGYESDEPIFIGGMPRSGTTLVDVILDAHPQVTAAGETGLFPNLVKHFGGGSQRQVMDPANLQGVSDKDLADLGRAYVESTRPISGETPRFTDKTPINGLYAGLIHRALPNAKIICTRRDPMDSVISFFRTLFLSTEHVYPSVYDLEQAAAYYVKFHKLADHWRATLPPERYLEVRYEALVSDQEGETRRLLEFLGLEFDERTLRFYEQDNVVGTASAGQVRQPVYTSAVGRWKRYGDRLRPAIDILRQAGIEVDA